MKKTVFRILAGIGEAVALLEQYNIYFTAASSAII